MFKELQTLSMSRRGHYFLNGVEGHERGIYLNPKMYPAIVGQEDKKVLVYWDSEKRNRIDSIETVNVLSEYYLDSVSFSEEQKKLFLTVSKEIVKNCNFKEDLDYLDVCKISLTEKTISVLKKAYNYEKFEPYYIAEKEKFDYYNKIDSELSISTAYSTAYNYAVSNIDRMLELIETLDTLPEQNFPTVYSLKSNFEEFKLDCEEYRNSDKELLALSTIMNRRILSETLLELLNLKISKVKVGKEVTEVEGDYSVTYYVEKVGNVYYSTLGKKLTSYYERFEYYGNEDRMFEKRRVDNKTFIKKELLVKEIENIFINDQPYKVEGLIYTKL